MKGTIEMLMPNIQTPEKSKKINHPSIIQSIKANYGMFLKLKL